MKHRLGAKSERWICLLALALLILLPDVGGCFDTEFHGRVQTTGVLRDPTGFQYGFYDEAKWVQLRNELKFDVDVNFDDVSLGNVGMDKVFLSYRGAYDAIFDLTDRYDAIPKERDRSDFMYGREDIKFENDLREGFVDFYADFDRSQAWLRLGRQLVSWGEADGFRLMDVINPNDNSTLMFFENPDDLKTPLWMARANYNLVGIGPFDSLGFEGLLTPDIRPTIFAPLDPSMSAPYAFPFAGLRGMNIKEDVPASTLDNAEWGAKVSFQTGRLNLALHYFDGYQDDPALDFGTLATEGVLTFRHPETKIYGFTFNYFLDSINAVLRGEGSVTDGEHLTDFENPDGSGIGEYKAYQALVGLDKDVWIRFLNKDMFVTAWQIYYKTYEDDYSHDRNLRPTEEENLRFTGLITTDYYHGSITPTLFFMYDTEGAWMTHASIKYTPDGRWYFLLSQISFYGNQDAGSPFSGLITTSETSFRVGYEW